MAIKIDIYSDYMCPFCYLAWAYVKELEKTWALEVEWINYELHPETPPEGVLLAQRFGEERLEVMIEGLRKAGAPFGIRFGELYFMPNSRMVLEASEYAKETGRFEAFHEAVFKAHFTHLADIGQIEVIADLARGCGMDEEALVEHLNGNTYTGRIQEIRREAERIGVGKPPFFIIDGRFKLERPKSLSEIEDVLKNTGKERG